ncbi:MAG: glutamine-hydrolyzing carbamoyl-phosphate synthase small subunit [Bacteroidales bacterium]|jgi:carbamoyl-phosphate synthase small subunit|nr:glutamine-hydrolyzing carbamoyl-phosphate synthase small subunit [Bacteroidales bacterium]
MADIKLVLEDGSEYAGQSFGYKGSTAGEVVFNTAMTGYPESLTDPSYKGQILVATCPIIGNYGIPGDEKSENGLPVWFESDCIHISALVVTDYTEQYSHWSACKSLGEWMNENRIPGITGVDTRAITKRLREKGTMLGKIVYRNADIPFYDPYTDHLVKMVSCREKKVYGNGQYRILLVDCGVKFNIIRDLVASDATVVRVPWDYDFLQEEYDGLFISNGPGDPVSCKATIEHLSKAFERNEPIMGICLGNQLMGLAANAKTYKLKYGHRSHNQPVQQAGSSIAFITAQNHGFAIDYSTLPDEWEPLYLNLNDRTNEGIRHKTKPFFSAQFHPEASGGTTDTEFLFGVFMEEVRKYRNRGK